MPTETIVTAPPAAPDRFAPRYGFIEFISIASHVGKSMMATFVALMLRQLGVPVFVVRIESKMARSKESSIHIDSEDFAGAARLPGGEVAILRPVYEALQAAAQKTPKPVIVLDWGGGLAEHRAKIFASTRFDDRLADLQMRGLSVVVTTSLADRMQHAQELIAQTQLITPNLDVALLLNRRVGSFSFVDGSEEKRIFRDLQKTAKNVPIIKIPAIAGETWKACEAAGLSMVEVVELPLVTLAKRLGGENPWLVSAFQMQTAAWWQSAEREVLQVLGAVNAAPSE
jgi:hypothetical protein